MAAPKPLEAPSTVPDLVERLGKVGGKLKVPDPSDAERRRWRRTLHAAINMGGLPDGMRLRYSGRDRGDLEIRLVADTEANLPRKPELDLPEILIPETLRGLHPLLAATRDAAAKSKTKDGRVSTFGTKEVMHLHIASGSLKRALRLAQALIAEAERRGGGARPATCGIGIALREPVIELVFTEENDRKPHEPTAAELREQERASRPTASGYVPYVRPMPKYDYFPSGRLVLRTGHDTYSGITLANDRKRWTLESRLALALKKIEDLTIEAEEKAAAALAAADQQERAWKAAMAEARHRWAEDHRLAVLTDQLQRRRTRVEIQELVDELRAAHNPQAGSSADAWIRWAEDHAASLDPIGDDLYMPDVPEPSPTDLQAILGNRWSAYGPSDRPTSSRRWG